MAGNSSRKGAVRKSNKKGATKGTGGNRRKGLEGAKATPKAEDRTYHAAYKRKQQKMRRDSGRQQYNHNEDRPELVLGRNPVVECLRAKVPATVLYVAQDVSADDRIAEAVHTAANRGIPVIETTKSELQRMSNSEMHQGIGLQIPPYEYADVDSIIDDIAAGSTPGMVVVLDNITDPRNLGAVIRSTAAFGGQAVVIPERRSASVTAVAWRTSAGTAARLPVAKATNLVQTLKKFQQAGYQVIGLDASDSHTVDDYDGTSPVVIVVGSEGKGISRLVKETCDTIVSVPMTPWVESLNASVAAGVVLNEFARQRRTQGKPQA